MPSKPAPGAKYLTCRKTSAAAWREAAKYARLLASHGKASLYEIQVVSGTYHEGAATKIAHSVYLVPRDRGGGAMTPTA